MPYTYSALRRAALPALAILATTSSSALAQSGAPVPPPLPVEGGLTVPIADVPTAGDGSLQGRLVRVIDKHLTVASGNTVGVRLRATIAPIHAELRVGERGRVVAQADVAAGQPFRLVGRASKGESLRLVVHRTDNPANRRNLAIGSVKQLRPTTASWYGPGIYGNRTACGQTLTSGLRGVAHKQLPCGTKLTIKHGGRSTTATVVDRGPFHGNREFDLTSATARAIGFSAVGRVWVSR